MSTLPIGVLLDQFGSVASTSFSLVPCLRLQISESQNQVAGIADPLRSNPKPHFLTSHGLLGSSNPLVRMTNPTAPA